MHSQSGILDGALLPDPAITISVEAFDEQGLLGLVLHPDFPAPPYIYVFYTPFTGNQTGNTNRVSRFTVDPTSDTGWSTPYPQDLVMMPEDVW